MASTNKTSLGLNKWVETDKPTMTDFNSDNQTLDALIAGKADKTALNLKADQTALNTLSTQKADKTDVTNLDAKKADKTALDLKADQTALNTLSTQKADKTALGITLPASGWVASTTYSGYAFEITVPIEGLTVNDYITTRFEPESMVAALVAQLLPSTASTEGTSTFYAKAVPSIDLHGAYKITTAKKKKALSAWTEAFVSSPRYYSVCYGNEKFVAIGRFEIAISQNGIDWAEYNTPDDEYSHSNDCVEFSSICYGNGLFSAIYKQRIYTSPDGIDWTDRTKNTYYYWNKIIYENGLFVAVGFDGYYGGIAISPDGIQWTYTFDSRYTNLRGISYGNDMFIVNGVKITGGTGLLFTSTDGINWMEAGTTSYYPDNVCYGNGTFFSMCYEDQFQTATSLDGINWETHPTSYDFVCSCFGDGMFVAITFEGSVLTSSDGINWTEAQNLQLRHHTSHSGEEVYDESCNFIYFGAGKFVVLLSGYNKPNRILTATYE